MKARRKVTKAVLWFMRLTRGEEMANLWAWEMTPMPVGLPSWRQIRVGIAMAIGLDFIAVAYQRAVEREEEEVMARWRSSHGG